MHFLSSQTVKMYDTDAAGILYFANQFRFAHDAFEELMASEGLSFQRLFDHEPYIFVIVHAESDYFSSLKVGDGIQVKTWISYIGESSFHISYDVFKGEVLTGRAKTVHVCIGKASRAKQSLPDEIRALLNKYAVLG
ncbi:MAG: acyl-CoA thioesterase [Candidatus Margulisiibacteriota bacterium]